MDFMKGKKIELLKKMMPLISIARPALRLPI
jgi:hypothetical protein